MTAPTDPPGLERLLAAGLTRLRGRPVRVTGLTRRPMRSASSHPIEHVQVRLADDERLALVLKRLRPSPERVAGREVRVYRDVLDPARFDTPRLYASVCDERSGDFWLLIENVGNWRLQWCSTPAWESAMRWLGRMHAEGSVFAGHRHLRRHDAEFYVDLVAGAVETLTRRGCSTAAQRLERLASARLDEAVAVLVAQPRTLLHGDLSCHNVLVQDGRIRPVDWEWAGSGPAAWDVAKLLDGWGRHRDRLLAAYCRERALAADPVDPPGFEAAIRLAGAMHRVWYLRWWTRDCDDPAVVDRMLNRVERAWTTAGSSPVRGAPCGSD